VNEDNVVPFDPTARGGMARRGAPDKSASPAAAAIVLSCPTCAAEFRLEKRWLEGETEALCGRCETAIPILALRQESGAG